MPAPRAAHPAVLQGWESQANARSPWPGHDDNLTLPPLWNNLSSAQQLRAPGAGTRRLSRREPIVDPTRRTLLTTAAAAAAVAAARAFAQQPAGQGASAGPFYQKGDVRIRYEETGSGFPL